MNLAVFLPNWIGDVAMATHQLGEGRLVAGARGSNQLGVGPWLAPLEAGHAP